MPHAFARCALLALSAASFAGVCGGPADASSVPADTSSAPPAAAADSPRTTGAADLLGTIEATIDGEARIWYVVSGSVRGDPYASAVWFETSDGGIVASLGGFDTADPPLETFQTDPAQGSSLGDYRGSAITVLMMPSGSVRPYETPLSEDAPGITLAPDASAPGIEGVYFGREGSLNVTLLEVVEDRLNAEGTFEGALRTFSGGGTVEITEGRFSVRGVPSRSSLAGGR